MTLRELVWAADGKLRCLWAMTGVIAAKIHNAHFTEPMMPWQFGPYADEYEETKTVRFKDLAELMEGIPGVQVTRNSSRRNETN